MKRTNAPVGASLLSTPDALVAELRRVMTNYRNFDMAYDVSYVAETAEALLDRYEADSILAQSQNTADTATAPTQAP